MEKISSRLGVVDVTDRALRERDVKDEHRKNPNLDGSITGDDFPNLSPSPLDFQDSTLQIVDKKVESDRHSLFMRPSLK